MLQRPPSNGGAFSGAATQWVKSRKWGKKLQFPTDSCKFPIEEIMGAQTFDFVHTFPPNGNSTTHDGYFWKKMFGQKEYVPTWLKFRRWVLLPLPCAEAPWQCNFGQNCLGEIQNFLGNPTKKNQDWINPI